MQNRKDQAIIALGLNVIQGAGTIKLFKRKRQMLNNIAEPLTLAAFTEEEKELLRTDLSYKKRISKLFKKARAESKRETCYYCGKPVSSFCNSHSIPKFCLKNIAVKGKVLTLNSILDNPLMDTQKGVKEAGTFHLICNDCDSKIFSDYENSENYKKEPTPKMIAQMALKNSLKSISKRLLEMELFNITGEKSFEARMFAEMKNGVNELDLKEYEENFEKAKRALKKDDESAYYVCYYKKLNYVVPIAFQCSLALVFDLEGNIINDVYNHDKDYKIRNINICILPMETESVIIMFIENGEKRYRNFYKQFNRLPLDEQLATLTFIMFAYSEDMYFSESIKEEILNNEVLCNAGKTSQDIFATTPFFDALEVIKSPYDLNKRHEIPNLLSEKFKVF